MFKVNQEQLVLDVVTLADAINQFAIQVEVYADRQRISANAKCEPGNERRAEVLFNAARKLREDIAGVIPE